MLRSFSYLQLRSPLQSLRDAYDILPESKTVFREGLYLSSPEFWQEFQKREQLNEKEKKKLELSYAKYWLRSSARCTPYGTFAGSSLIPITEEPSVLGLTPNDCHRRSLRLDMSTLAAIVHALLQLQEVRDHIQFFPNNSIYPTTNGYRFAAYSTLEKARNYQLESVERTPYLAALLARASGGATLPELAEKLMAIEDVSREEADGFITGLWESQLLIAGLEPSVTGAEPLAQLIGQLEPIAALHELVDKLKQIRYLLDHPESGPSYYEKVQESLQQLGLDAILPKNTFQVDLFLGLKEAHINQDLVAVILKQASGLSRLSRLVNNADLQHFKRKFFARYEEAEIPLCIALDADLGIGYAGSLDDLAGGSDIIDGLPVLGKQEQMTTVVDYIQQYALVKYNDWVLKRKGGIEIQEEELKAFEKNTVGFRLPGSMFLMGSLLSRDGQLDDAHFTFDMAGFGGPSGANFLGRFTSGDAALCQYVRDILKSEEQAHPDHIYAEIAHLPQARVGNILLRPVLRAYEVPYVGLSGADKDHQIPVADLFVSVRNDEIILRSKKHNKRVIPRLTTAHNFSAMSLPVYKFLCDLQVQGHAYPFVWDWGSLALLKYLPRVTYKNLIIHKALWTIGEKDVADLFGAGDEWLSYAAIFRDRFGLPERVVYKEGDNELLIDFTRSKGIELFLHYLKRHKTIKLEEFLFNEDNCVVCDIDGAPYTNEMIIPVYQDAAISSNRERIWPRRGENETQRTFLPYSEWLYFKIYTGSKTIEELLSATILPFVEEGIAGGLFERFFFIRYRDESGGHIRIRFYNTDTDKQLLLYKKLNRLLQPLMDNGSIDKVMLDTYKRELERYTPGLIDGSETLFHNDSLAVLRFIHMLDGIDGSRYRLLFAMRGVAALLDDFGLSPNQKAEFLKERQAAFFKEFGGQAPLQKQLNERYRKNQRFIADHMDERKDIENEIDDAAEVFRIRSAMNRPVIREMVSALPEPDRNRQLTVLLASYIHMFVNRLFIAQQRKYELVVYHFLEKYYVSSMAIAKKEKQDAVSAL